jgi:hypothetical protein
MLKVGLVVAEIFFEDKVQHIKFELCQNVELFHFTNDC